MCEPTTIMMGVGMAMSLMGSMQEASAQKDAGKYNQQVAQNNALNARRHARLRGIQGDKSAANIAIEARKAAGLRIAQGAGQGIDVGDENGSIMFAVEDILNQGRRNVGESRLETQIAQQGLLNQAGNFEGQGELARFEGDSAASSTLLSGAGTALATGAVVHDKWTQLGKATEDTSGGIWD